MNNPIDRTRFVITEISKVVDVASVGLEEETVVYEVRTYSGVWVADFWLKEEAEKYVEYRTYRKK